jgi:hypothetical protein
MLPGSTTYLVTTRGAKIRQKDTLWHLHNKGLYPRTFYGYDIEKTGITSQNFFTYDRGPQSTYRIGPKTTNIYLSHYSAWQACLYQPGDSFTFLEDDARLSPNWRTVMSSVIKDLPSDWDLLFPGSCCALNEGYYDEVKKPLYAVRHILCLHCYIIRKKALPMILEALESFSAPVDVALCLEVVPKLKTFAIIPSISRQSSTAYPA